MLGVKILNGKEDNHPEPNNNNGDRVNNIVHFHVYDGLNRGAAQRMDSNWKIKTKYSEY